MDLTQVRTAAIIGTGEAGLATAKMLSAEGIEVALFERSSTVGGVWAAGYANFGVQVQKELYEIPDWPLPADAPNFTPGPTIQRYLADYAGHFGLTQRIRFDSTLVDLEARSDGRPGWTVVAREADELYRADFDLVVICVGLYSDTAHMPSYPGQESFQGQVLHSSQVRSRDLFRGKNVVVVGFGKSATDIALESAAVGDETTLVCREAHWPIPRRLLGIVPFKWGMLHRLNSAFLPLYQHPSRLERLLHGVGWPLVWLYWRLQELLLALQHGLGRVGMRPRTPLEVDSFNHAVMLPRPELYRSIRRGVIHSRRAEISSYTPTGIELASGEHVEADVVVLGTGWETDYGFLPAKIRATIGFEDDGYYLYRHLLHPDVPNLVFVGSNASTFCNMLTHNLQARWLVELIRGRHQLLPREAMLREIAEMKAWKRAWMPKTGARGAAILGHMLHYHDELLRDFGARPKRKTGWLAPIKELLAPYEPSDYATVVSGEWEREQRGSPRSERAA